MASRSSGFTPRPAPPLSCAPPEPLAASRSRFSLRFLRRPVDSREASLDGSTSLLEHLLAAVLLGLASHAAVVVLFVVVTALALCPCPAYRGWGSPCRQRRCCWRWCDGCADGSRRRCARSCCCRKRCDRYDGHRGGRCCRHDGYRARRRARPWPCPRRPSSLLEHGLLCGDLVEQRTEARTGVGSGNGAALGLAGSLLPSRGQGAPARPSSWPRPRRGQPPPAARAAANWRRSSSRAFSAAMRSRSASAARAASSAAAACPRPAWRPRLPGRGPRSPRRAALRTMAT